MGATRVTIDGLSDALAVGERDHIALVGGGGKTTALFALGQQLSPGVVLTTTTKMGTDRTGGHRPLIDPDDAALARAVEDHGAALVWRTDEGHRAEGVDPERCDAWFERFAHVVVEADGSRRHPFKAPAPHEPVVPTSTTLLVACVGASAIGVDIATACHRPERVAELCGVTAADPLTVERLAHVLAHDDGSMKGRPSGARAVVLVNRVEDVHRRPLGELADRLDGIVPVVGVDAFAAGASPEA